MKDILRTHSTKSLEVPESFFFNYYLFKLCGGLGRFRCMEENCRVSAGCLWDWRKLDTC